MPSMAWPSLSIVWWLGEMHLCKHSFVSGHTAEGTQPSLTQEGTSFKLTGSMIWPSWLINISVCVHAAVQRSLLRKWHIYTFSRGSYSEQLNSNRPAEALLWVTCGQMLYGLSWQSQLYMVNHFGLIVHLSYRWFLTQCWYSLMWLFEDHPLEN